MCFITAVANALALPVESGIVHINLDEKTTQVVGDVDIKETKKETKR